MKLKFEKLQHQKEAVASIISVFQDCQFKEPDSKTEPDLKTRTNPRCDFSKVEDNIKNIRQKNKLANYGNLRVKKDEPLNLDILMETGTGKTFTFIDTIYRLNENFGLAKFIVLMPSNAIRAGTVKNLEITKEYFQNSYSKAKLSVLEHSEQNIYRFVQNSNRNISVLIATFASFNKITNKIHKKNLEQSLLDRSKSYIEAVAKIKPVVIIDEPHRAGGEKTKKFLPSFGAQIIFRFGATFRKDNRGEDYCNLVYALDSAVAFKEGLVKSITVHSLGLQNRINIHLLYKKFSGSSTNCIARMEYKTLQKTQSEEVRKGTNLGKLFDELDLKDYIIEKITKKEIIFDNGFTLPFQGSISCSELKEEIQKGMLKKAIDLHFEKERVLFLKNIKALSLFFIDRVDDYLGIDKKQGKLSEEFERLYLAKKKEVLAEQNLNEDYRAYLQKDREQDKVHNGYFSRSSKEKDNQETIDLILREKEKLLSLETPLRFIFSKWALQEGWDNPNIFTLTKLAPSASSVSKLQQIGRGLRLAVTQEGSRITKEDPNFHSINLLDVIVAQDESDFVKGIQENISENSLGLKLNSFKNTDLIKKGIFTNEREANTAIDELKGLAVIQADDDYFCDLKMSKDEFNQIKEKITNQKLLEYLEDIYKIKDKVKTPARKKQRVKINAENFKVFKELWENLNSKVVYNYNLDSKILIANILAVIKKDEKIQEMKMLITTTKKVEDANKQTESYKEQTVPKSERLNLVQFLFDLIERTRLTPKTLIQILEQIPDEKFAKIEGNFRFALEVISEICNLEIHKLMVQSIDFELVENRIKTALTDDKGKLLEEIDLSSLGIEPYELQNNAVQKKSLFEKYIAVDSEIEKTTAEESNMDIIEVFAKLPRIKIPTPVGSYSPDFAFVLKNEYYKKIYFIIETKGYSDIINIRPKEEQKIAVGEKFCKALEKKGLNIHFQTKTTQKKLRDIISEIRSPS